MKISVRHRFLPKTNSLRASMVMDAFGIDFEQGEHLIADNLELPIEAGQIVAFTGDSGGGKSSLLREVSHQLRTNGASLVSLDEIELPDKILVDVIDLEFSESVRLLSACGLGEAHLLLRTPHELSDGQRYRFRLAKALSQTPDWIIADEYTATLDRTLAKVVSLNLHKLNSRCQTGFLIATTHEDILPDLNSHLHIRCRLNGQVEVNQQSAAGCKKKTLLRRRPLDLHRDQSRLAVLRSVALPQPRHRIHPLHDLAVVRRGTNRNLCFQYCAKDSFDEE